MNYSLSWGLCLGLGETTRQRLTSPSFACCMDLNARRRCRLPPFVLVLFNVVLLLNLCTGFKGQGGGWTRGFSRRDF